MLYILDYEFCIGNHIETELPVFVKKLYKFSRFGVILTKNTDTCFKVDFLKIDFYRGTYR